MMYKLTLWNNLGTGVLDPWKYKLTTTTDSSVDRVMRIMFRQ